MSTLFDIIGAGIIVGIMLLTMFGLNVNLHQVTYNKTFTLITQTNTVTLARMMEFDMVKIGYVKAGYTKPAIAMLAAKSDSIAFTADLYNTGTVNIVQYYLGPTSAVGFTKNPRDRMMYRVEDGKVTAMNLGVTSVSFTYYDLNNIITSTLSDIRGFNVKFTVESPEPVDTSYASTFWEKAIYPKNLWTN